MPRLNTSRRLSVSDLGDESKLPPEVITARKLMAMEDNHAERLLGALVENPSTDVLGYLADVERVLFTIIDEAQANPEDWTSFVIQSKALRLLNGLLDGKAES